MYIQVCDLITPNYACIHVNHTCTSRLFLIPSYIHPIKIPQYYLLISIFPHNKLLYNEYILHVSLIYLKKFLTQCICVLPTLLYRAKYSLRVAVSTHNVTPYTDRSHPTIKSLVYEMLKFLLVDVLSGILILNLCISLSNISKFILIVYMSSLNSFIIHIFLHWYDCIFLVEI